MTGDGLTEALFGFLTGGGGRTGVGDLLADCDLETEATGRFLGAGSGDRDMDLDDVALRTTCTFGEIFLGFFGSGVRETRRIGLLLGDGDI
uniref:Uncharacterized protein n=1 Tax=Kangiella spongicola TaxID=796379 RepID=A0A318D659_9GAMM